MSLAVVYSRALSGMQAPLVEVEAHLANGLPAFNIVGLADTEVRESRDRVRAAIVQSGFEFPTKKITINLAPADLPKESGRFDLPIAMSILAASGQVDAKNLSQYEFAGELALSGDLRPIRGTVAMVWQATQSNRSFILPEQSAQMATLVTESSIFGAPTLLAVCAHLNNSTLLPLAEQTDEFSYNQATEESVLDLADVRGQETARLALELAASGGHSLLLIGPPGTGKSMLAARLPSILPDLSSKEMLETAALYSLLNLQSHQNIKKRPFRSPHHTISAVALVGGSSPPKPGEISLAHNGILFLDELTQFNRHVLEVLREPLETGEIHISRANSQAVFPAQFQLIAAMNPCPCGYLGHNSRPCQCSEQGILRYQSKISGPFLDRIDLTIEVPSLSSEDLTKQKLGENSTIVHERVLKCREKQLKRQGKVNAQLNINELESLAQISLDAQNTLAILLDKLSLSARSYHKLLRVARTIADRENSDDVLKAHVLRAVAFRRSLNEINPKTK